ncbi:alcohol dehydrogenase catalytic domain-containing protein [Pseudomonas aeruginosa]|uniref:zinc-binding dehydrogenase n=1 Tax=Pseudomonas aeruginosa TaxID=287 RepID=UPI000EB25DE2|nr:alcohol dehydrogenase catalytic domain-containing protein [Pseudomonas aeruginosa]MEB3081556.1 alcohol dehydrogenase catalytic domain-containing protein [Pseudomonas aeruginosa]MEB3143012.1 alcohol dehydrogenase catalytic domain-containing protein [Pseudomonas aeruginosa]
MKAQVVKAQTVVEFGAPLEERVSELPPPTGREVLVRVHSCGLCHTDLHFHEGHLNLGGGNFLPLPELGVKPPFVLGHEPFGEIVAFGPDTGLTAADVGRSVIVYPWIGCGDCQYCNSGRDHQCQNPQVIGMQQPGGNANHLLVRDAKFLIDASGVDKLLAGSYACSGLTSFSALKKLDGLQDQWIGIVGVGGVGMMALSIAKGIGYGKVVAIDVNDDRLEVAAAQYGADLTINSSRADAAERLHEATGGLAGIVDFVGSADTATFGLAQLATGGKLIVVGLFGGELRTSLPLVAIKQLTITGSFVGSLSEMTELMTYVRAGKVKEIPAQEVPIGDVNQAMAQLRAGKVNGRLVLTHD